MALNTNGLRPSRLSRALAAAIVIGGVVGTAQAQQAQQDSTAATAETKKPTNVEGVVVTGSRIKRTQIEGPSPVTVISSTQIQREGFVTVFVNNVFNKFHPEDGGYNTYPYFWRAYSPIGREVSAQLEYSFD